MKTIIKIINFVGDNILKICAVLVVLILGVYLLWYVPYRDQNKIDEQQRQENLKEMRKVLEKREQEEKVIECQRDTWDAYSGNWDGMCEANGMKADCNLALNMSKTLGETREKGLNNCLKIFQ